MKKNPLALLATTLVLSSALVACGGAKKTDSTKTSAGAKKTVAELFPKSISVFGVSIVGTLNTPDASMIHAANVMAEYLDSNEDGNANSQTVVAKLVAKGATLIMTKDGKELESLSGQLAENDAYQDLNAGEVIVGDSTNLPGDKFDATLEEVLHLISHVGFAEVHPTIFGEKIGTVLADSMDKARGGQFTTIPATYPAGAWYTYDDKTCTYSCMATEYFYWSLTSILGAQDTAGRLENIKDEWSLNTNAKVQSTDASIYALLTDAQYGLPSKLPNGTYNFKKFTVTKR